MDCCNCTLMKFSCCLVRDELHQTLHGLGETGEESTLLSADYQPELQKAIVQTWASTPSLCRDIKSIVIRE